MPKPNIILIVLDTVRSKNMSCYGYERKTTPFLDEFSSENIFYNNAFSPAIWTIPSHASLFTGKYPSSHGALNLHRYLDSHYMTISEVFNSAGYDTISFSNNGFISIKDFGLSRGFKISEGQPHPKKKIGRIFQKGNQWMKGLIDCGASGTNKFVKNLLTNRTKSDKPFFLFLNYMEAHAPYKNIPRKYLKMFIGKAERKKIKTTNQDRQKFLTRSIHMAEEDFLLLRSVYDVQIAYLDFKIYELIKFLKQKNIYDNSLIIITSDHGDMIGEHNLMHHSYCIYDELIKIPLILKLPGTGNQGKIIDDPVSLMNIAPTIINILGIDNEAFANQMQENPLSIDGNDYKSDYIFSECERPKNEFKDTYPDFDFSVYDKHFLTIRSMQYKFIWSSNGQHKGYKIDDDPSEQTNLIKKETELSKKLENRLFKWYNSLEKVDTKREKSINLNEDVKDRLKALGYF